MKFTRTGSTSILRSLSPKIGEELIFTPSSNFNYTIPDCWALSWVTTEDTERARVENILGWSQTHLKQVQDLSDELFEEKVYGWPNMFESATELSRYLTNVQISLDEVVVVSLSFPLSEIEDLTRILKPEDEKIGDPGLYQFALRGIEEDRPLENIYGFDVVGIEVGGILYTSNQFGLRKDLELKHGVKYNSFGLIESIEDCFRVIDFVNENKDSYENVPWFVCRIDRELHLTSRST